MSVGFRDAAEFVVLMLFVALVVVAGAVVFAYNFIF